MLNDRNAPRVAPVLLSDPRPTGRVIRPDDDPRVAELRAAVARLGHELAAQRFPLPDDALAQQELATLDARAATGDLPVTALRGSLLVLDSEDGSLLRVNPHNGSHAQLYKV